MQGKEKKMNFFKLMILLLIASEVIVLSGCAKKARKQSTAFDKKAVFEAIDENHDRKIGKREYRFIWKDKNMAEEYFKQLDRDKNGFLTDDEFIVPWVLIPLKKGGNL